eukprot:120436-Chlamydomonas_euryale.AAC.2
MVVIATGCGLQPTLHRPDEGCLPFQFRSLTCKVKKWLLVYVHSAFKRLAKSASNVLRSAARVSWESCPVGNKEHQHHICPHLNLCCKPPR